MSHNKRITSSTVNRPHSLTDSEKVGMFLLQLQKLDFNVFQDEFGFSWTHKEDISAGYVSRDRIISFSTKWFINEVLELIELVTDWDLTNSYYIENVAN